MKWLLWLLALLAGAPHVTTTQKDKDYYVGVVAAEMAYAARVPSAPVVKPKVPRSKCTTCGGTGKVRTGDGQDWTNCPDCEPDQDTGKRPVLKSTDPGQGWPARSVPSVSR